MTSWRSGRLGGCFGEEELWDQGVVCRRRSERMGAGRGLSECGGGQDRFGSPNSNKSARDARGHHTQAPVGEAFGHRTRCDSTESTGLGNESRRFGVNRHCRVI